MEKYLQQDLQMEVNWVQVKDLKEDINSVLLLYLALIFLLLNKFLVEFSTCSLFRDTILIQNIIIKENIPKWEKLMLGVKIKEDSQESVTKLISTLLKKLNTQKKDLRKQYVATIFQQVFLHQTKHIFGETISIFAIEK